MAPVEIMDFQAYVDLRNDPKIGEVERMIEHVYLRPGSEGKTDMNTCTPDGVPRTFWRGKQAHKAVNAGKSFARILPRHDNAMPRFSPLVVRVTRLNQRSASPGDQYVLVTGDKPKQRDQNGPVHDAEYAYDEEAWQAISSPDPSGHVLFPARLDGKTITVRIQDSKIALFFREYARLCPNMLIGPVRLHLRGLGTTSILGMPGEPQVFGKAELFPAPPAPPPTSSISSLAKISGTFDTKKKITDVYLKFTRSDRLSFDNFTRHLAFFFATPHTEQGEAVSFMAANGPRGTPKRVTELCFTGQSLVSLVGQIQSNEHNQFSEVTMHVMESTVQYGSDPVHYYLTPVLNAPGVPTKVKKSGRKVLACAACDAMLLRYSFEYVMQRDDPRLAECPYCRAHPLVTVERPARVVPVTLDFAAKGCHVNGTNNQVGITYHGVPVKITIKLKAMEHFLQNMGACFESGLMGPVTVAFTNSYNRAEVNHVQFDPTLKPVQWRPVVLYGEDLFAL